MENIDRDEVLRVVKMRGPLIPNDLKKALGKGDTTLLGALLGELSSKGLVKVSHTKLGGSPYYYDPANPAGLERIAEHLGEKDQRTFNLLKDKKVLRDDKQEALVRVSLRNIKDFSRMLKINAPEGPVIYWKYFLLSDADAEQMIKEDLGMAKAAKAPEPPAEPKPAPAEPKPAKPTVAPAAPAQPKQEEKPRPNTGAKVEKIKKTEPKEEQQELTPIESIQDPFYSKVKGYFDRNKITVKEQKLIRKKSELDFVIVMPTPVGNVEYYCKAKAKKKSNDGDLAAAKLQGNARNLPVIYLTTGEITKKAKEKLQSDFKGLVVKEL